MASAPESLRTGGRFYSRTWPYFTVNNAFQEREHEPGAMLSLLPGTGCSVGVLGDNCSAVGMQVQGVSRTFQGAHTCLDCILLHRERRRSTEQFVARCRGKRCIVVHLHLNLSQQW